MTLDDNSSIYVGGLPYDVSEEALRRVFYVYGSIIAIKIINDRSVGGKCYGFVTFDSQRSAMQAIKEMDGKTVNGRIVKVNDVRTRGRRPNLNRDNSRHDLGRSIEGDRGRDRGRGDNYDFHRQQEGHTERSQDSDLNRESGHDRSRGRHDRRRDRYVDEESRLQDYSRHVDDVELENERKRDHYVDEESRLQDYSRHVDDVELENERKRDHYVDEESRLRDYNRHVGDVELENGRKRKRDWDRDSEKSNEQQRNNPRHRSGDQDKQHQVQFQRRSRFDDHGSREISLESYNDDQDQSENKLAVSNQKLEEFRREISRMEELIADKQEDVSKLQEKCQKLEDSLNAAKKLTSRRRIQITKLHKCYSQMRDYDEKSKKSEQELQWLIDSTATELGTDGGGIGDGVVTNGRA